MIDFGVYKYCVENITRLVLLIVVLVITLLLYLICLPFIWFKPVQKLFSPFEKLISDLT